MREMQMVQDMEGEGKWRQLTAKATGLTPFSIMEMQIDRVRRSSWQF